MSDHPTKPAHSYLHEQNQDLRSLFAKIKLLKALNAKVSGILDPDLGKYCQVANLVENRLVLMAANGSIATHLRFQTPDLLKQFKTEPLLANIRYIQCKVCPPSSLHTPSSVAPQRIVQPLSEETAAVVADMAMSLEDPGLREVMERIASRRTKA